MRWVRGCVAALVAGAIGLAGLAGTVAAAPSPVDASAAFLRRFLVGDPAACAQFSPAALARMQAAELPCAAWARETANALDLGVKLDLELVLDDATQAALDWHGDWLPPKGGPRALVRALRGIEGELTIRLGNGPGAARGLGADAIVVDSHSTARRLVLYAKGKSGRVWALTAVGQRKTIAVTALRGAPLVAVAPRPGVVIASGPGHSTVLAAIGSAEDGSALIGVDANGLIDLFQVGDTSGLQAGAAAPDGAAFADDLLAGWSAPTASLLCDLSDAAFVKRAKMRCDERLGFPAGSVTLGAAAFDAPVAGGGALVEIAIVVEGQRISLLNLVSATPVGDRLVGFFLDPVALRTASNAIAKLPI